MSVPCHDDDFGGELRASTSVTTSTMLKHKHLSHGSKKALEHRFTFCAKCCDTLRAQVATLPSISTHDFVTPHDFLIAPGSPGRLCARGAVRGNQFAEFPDGAVS